MRGKPTRQLLLVAAMASALCLPTGGEAFAQERGRSGEGVAAEASVTAKASQSKRVVRRLPRWLGMPADGVVGPQT